MNKVIWVWDEHTLMEINGIEVGQTYVTNVRQNFRQMPIDVFQLDPIELEDTYVQDFNVTIGTQLPFKIIDNKVELGQDGLIIDNVINTIERLNNNGYGVNHIEFKCQEYESMSLSAYEQYKINKEKDKIKAEFKEKINK